MPNKDSMPIPAIITPAISSFRSKDRVLRRRVVFLAVERLEGLRPVDLRVVDLRPDGFRVVDLRVVFLPVLRFRDVLLFFRAMG
ncbi:MAG: hypothetical protein H8D34_08700 [Chloroflexi bacterium]|nr:hypothetical protein [Chloroflexota bacterium]